MRGVGILSSITLLLSHLAVGGCAVMPVSGPESWDVWAGQHDPKNIPYAFVRITPKVANVLGKALPGLSANFRIGADRAKSASVTAMSSA